MPDTYWPTDNKLRVSPRKYAREQFGLPRRTANDKTVVFGSFNQTYKIERYIFESWLRILKKVPKSVLYLYDTYGMGENNLIKFVKSQGINPKRIIFAKELTKEKHLARIRDTVDIALDTKTVNGHTTTTDCLWVGVPVITIKGKHFASRVSTSMLNAIGLPELVTNDLKQYEDLAVALATDPFKLNKIKAKIKKNIKTKPLFNTEIYTRNLEKAYTVIWKKYLNGKPKKDIYIKQ
ncbi:hypothetical protein A2W32_01835 [candidate division WWE3 bacterium RBG_16_37_10]|uniref:O-GlcNAc transferase C-terminal domain-containing protein n=1 Tax=candidate division WWE3 bacterium RBG_16_37_10 TaxID=1802610 RepID=A0A1F4UWJ7_UNCKA|nr:MAG: hypothetical protein A2W32_01835 [candidate division WWE3 bacterium RBG_16_37_10]